MKALGIAATGMQAQQTNVDVISNNIANANTTGFRAARAAFQDLMYQSRTEAGGLVAEGAAARPVGFDVGLGVQAAGTIRNTSQGGLNETGGSLDMAIEGRGFFAVERADGSTAYTRDGSFQVSAEGELVTMTGARVSPGIAIPEEATGVEISRDGVVTAFMDGDPEPVELGEITLAGFVNEAGLKPLGDNLMGETAASGAPIVGTPGEDGLGALRQGYLEGSNVNIIEQITRMITAQRAYEMNSKTIQTADNMLQAAGRLK